MIYDIYFPKFVIVLYLFAIICTLHINPFYSITINFYVYLCLIAANQHSA